jgi:hypothetical protein
VSREPFPWVLQEELAGLGELPAPDDVCPRIVLTSAGCYLNEYGWVQGTHYQSRLPGTVLPAASLLGALAIVTYGFPVAWPGMRAYPGWVALQRALCALEVEFRYTGWVAGGQVIDVDDFNDQPAMTLDHIRQALSGAWWRHLRMVHAGIDGDAADVEYAYKRRPLILALLADEEDQGEDEGPAEPMAADTSRRARTARVHDWSRFTTRCPTHPSATSTSLIEIPAIQPPPIPPTDFAGTAADRKGGTAPGPTDLTDREAGGQQ